MMTAEQLKGSILQLAMQGKLVEQRPEEGTGEELYKKILAEKKKLIKEGKVKNQKNLSPITEESAPFEIPESWKWTNLGEIIDYRMGKTPPRAETAYWGNDIFWVSIADMVDGKTITETKEKISHKALVERFNGQISPKGTLIMSFKLTVGRVSILGMDAVHNEAIISIFPFVNTDDVIRDYLKTMLPFLSVYGESKKAIKGFTLNSASLSQIPVPLPPLAEQKRIVAKIEELMPFVEQYAAVSTKLNSLNASFPEMMKKSILQEAVQGKLVPQDPNDEPASLLLKKIAEEKKRLIKEGKIKKQKPLPEITEDEIPFDIPESWEWVRLDSVVDMLSGFAFKSPDFKPEGEYRLLRGINLGVGTIRWDDTVFVDNMPNKLEIYRIQKGDVLLGLDRPWISEGIRVGIYDGPDNTYLVQRVLRIRDIGVVTNHYLALILRSTLLKNTVEAQTTGISVPHISQKQVGNIVIPVPPRKEQERIISRIHELTPMLDGIT